ncbi:MAG: hypothetical protein R3Y70_03010 [Rikenellaceae bacterium]
MMVVSAGLVVAAVTTGGSPAMVGLNLLWAYFLVAFGVASAAVCAVLGMINAPAGLKMTLISVGAIAMIVVISTFIASSHTIQIVNIGDGGYFDAGDTVITEASILVTYVAMAGALLAALGGEILGIVEANKK